MLFAKHEQTKTISCTSAVGRPRRYRRRKLLTYDDDVNESTSTAHHDAACVPVHASAITAAPAVSTRRRGWRHSQQDATDEVLSAHGRTPKCTNRKASGTPSVAGRRF